MTVRSPYLRLIFVLCAFAVLGAQIFGLSRGYLCDCSGSVEVVKISSCEGLHGIDCHDESAHDVSDSEDHDGGDRKEHDELKGSLTSTIGTVPHVVVPSPVVLSILPDFSLFYPEPTVSFLEYVHDAFGGPPPSIALSRTVVLRI